MAFCIRYTCRSELLPSIEAVLAANGYSIASPFHRSHNGATTLVMTCGLATLLLASTPTSDLAEIEVGGVALTAAMQLLESLPIPLYRQLTQATTHPANSGEYHRNAQARGFDQDVTERTEQR
jgi:hypothetical protein